MFHPPLTEGSGSRLEIVRGEVLVSQPNTDTLHWQTWGSALRLLQWALKEAALSGYISAGGTQYILSYKDDQIYNAFVPDVAFVEVSQIPPGWDGVKAFRGAPSLVVEVVHPDDSAEETLARVREYLRAGCPQVWLLYPRGRELHTYVPGVTQAALHEAGSSVPLYGVPVAVEGFFRPPILE